MNQTLRLPYAKLTPLPYKALTDASTALRQASIGKKLVDLVFLRVSQINGCAFCIDKHAFDLLAQGEDIQRINSLSTWREVDFFDAREQAALAWAECLADIGHTGANDADFAAVRAQFSEQEVAELSFAVAVMSAWNRMGVAMRQPVQRRADVTSPPVP